MIIKYRSKLLVAISAITILTLASSVLVYASYFGRGEGEGYFKGNSESGGWDSKYNVIENGISKSDSSSASKLLGFLQETNSSGSTQDKVGAAFIVKTMLGKKADGDGKTVTKDEWIDIENRLINIYTNGSVSWQSFGPCGEDSSYYQTGNKDDAFYNLSTKVQTAHLGFNVKSKTLTAAQKKKLKSFCGDHDVLQFKINGNVVYRLDKDCANPIGNISSGGIPKPKLWYISDISDTKVGDTKADLVSSSIAKPGQIIVWSHPLRNDGPDDTTKSIHSNIVITGFSNEWNGTRSDGDTGSGKSKGTIRNITDYATYDHVSQYDVGNNLCEKVQFQQKSWNDVSADAGNNACVFVPYRYTLTPKIDAGPNNVVEVSTAFNLASTVGVRNNPPDKDPYRTKTKTTQWRVSQIVVAPNYSVPANTVNMSTVEPCSYFNPSRVPGSTCSNKLGANQDGKSIEATGSNVFSEDGAWPVGSTGNNTSVVAEDYAAGTHICYIFSVQARADFDTQWAYSAPACLVIGKKPKVQITGGDIWVKGLIKTSFSDKNIAGASHRFGSWGEYGVSAYGLVTGMASGSAFAGSGLVLVNPDSACEYSKITFTNAGNSTCGSSVIGNYTSTHKIPDVAASFVVNTNDATHNLGDSPPIDLSANNLQGSYRATGDIKITGGGLGKVVSKGRWIVINAPTANVTISGDINYTGEVLRSITDIPQVVIIAKTITIAADVENVDAWLIAVGDGTNSSGIINTCSAATLPDGGNLTIDICEKPLVINGPVMADKIYLYRTAGSGTGTDDSGKPAEVFNLRADVYLWALSRAGSGSHIQTVHTIELPPRF